LHFAATPHDVWRMMQKFKGGEPEFPRAEGIVHIKQGN
jgi:hypothetical protein